MDVKTSRARGTLDMFDEWTSGMRLATCKRVLGTNQQPDPAGVYSMDPHVVDLSVHHIPSLL